eukprot:257755_1
MANGDDDDEYQHLSALFYVFLAVLFWWWCCLECLRLNQEIACEEKLENVRKRNENALEDYKKKQQRWKSNVERNNTVRDQLQDDIRTIEQHKQNGYNAYTKETDYVGALMHYKTAINKLQLPEVSHLLLNQHSSKYFQLLIDLHSGAALMYLKIGGDANCINCIKHCDEVLEHEPNHQEALLQKAEAEVYLNYYLNKVNPHDKEVKTKLLHLEAREKLKQEENVMIDMPQQPPQIERKSTDESQLCIICMDGKRDYSVIPCGHLCLCSECKDSMNGTCPVCRSEYQSINRIYK